MHLHMIKSWGAGIKSNSIVPYDNYTRLCTDENQKLIVDYGGLSALIPLLRSPDAETVTAAVAAIRNLSIHRDNAVSM